MKDWELLYICMTNSGVSFPITVIVSAFDMNAAMDKAQEHLARGATVSLQVGAPPIPVQISAASLFSCKPAPSNISIHTGLPDKKLIPN